MYSAESMLSRTGRLDNRAALTMMLSSHTERSLGPGAVLSREGFQAGQRDRGQGDLIAGEDAVEGDHRENHGQLNTPHNRLQPADARLQQ